MALLGFFIFTAGVFAITAWLTRNDNHSSSKDYFLGGRSLTAGVIAGSLMLTNLSTEQLVGLSGQAFQQGILVMAWEVFGAAALIILALYFLPRYLRSGLTTTPEFLEERFDRTTRSFVDFFFLAGYAFILLPVVLVTGAKVINGMFDVQSIFLSKEMLAAIQASSGALNEVQEAAVASARSQAIWLIVGGIGILGSIYAIFGGLRAVAISDTINGIGFLIGCLAIPFAGLCIVGDGSLIEGWNKVTTTNPAKFVSNGNRESFIPWESLFTGMLLVNVFYWCTNQAITQRAMAAKNLKEGQKGVLIAACLKIIGPLMLVLPGIIAFHLYANEIESADDAYGVLVKNLLADRPFITGLFAAVLVGAILSSFNSALNSASTLFSLGFYKKYFKKSADDKSVVRSGKIFGIGLALFSMALAPNLDKLGSIFDYLQKINGLYSIPVITIFLAGYCTKTITATAAKWGMWIGVGVYGVFTFAGIKALSDIHFLHQMMLTFVITFGIMLFFPKRETPFLAEDKVEEGYDMQPWKHAKKASVIIAILAIGIYLVFWSKTATGPTPEKDKEYKMELISKHKK